MPDLPTGTITFLFTDIEGSTALWEQQPAAMRQALIRHDTLVEQVVAEHDGCVVRPRGEGDSRFAVFARATDAVAAAAALQQVLHAEPWPTPTPVRVRMALHTGEADLREGDYYGSAVNRCARLRGTAHGGQILVSLATEQVVREHPLAGIDLRDLGEHRLKDLRHPDHIFQLVIPDLPSDFPPLKTPDAHPHNLPAQRDALIGRERELTDVTRLLRRANVGLVTLTGPGGTGKTRLALQVAGEVLDSFPDGVFLVALAAVRDPDLVVPTMAQTLGISQRGGGSLLTTVRTYVADKRLLLVLDNFEQVLDAAPLVGDLLAHAPGVKLLATSRERLRLAGEQVIVVLPLAVVDPPTLPQDEAALLATLRHSAAVRLFVARAQAAQADFVLTAQNARAVAAICYRLDGLPLALELAAARLRLLSPEALLARLDHRLPLLVGGPRNAPARQQTLRTTIAWSYDLLAAKEQCLFRRLAVFDGGCAFEALAPVCALNGDLVEPDLDLLEALTDKSLVRVDHTREPEPRIEMLATIREYGWGQLVASGEAVPIRQQHAAFFLALAEQSAVGLVGPEQARWLQRMETERANLRAALTWALEQAAGELVLRLYVSLLPFWWIRDLVSEGRWWRDAVTPFITDRLAPAVYAHALHVSGWLASSLREFAEAERLLGRSLALAQRLDDRDLRLTVLKDLAASYRMQGHDQQAVALFEEALVLARAGGNPWILNYVLGSLGMIAAAQGASRKAEGLLEEALAVARAAGDQGGSGWWLALLGKTAVEQGDLPRAGRYLRESLELFIALRHTDATAFTLEGIAGLATALGDPRQAGRLFGFVERLREQLTLPRVPFDRPHYERDVAATRVRLGEEVFAAMWAAGRALPPEQAIDEATQLLRRAEPDRPT